MRKLLYKGYTIAMQEVPDEVSLVINISGCPHKCEGCHSKYLWEYSGDVLVDDISSLYNKYTNLITCVCFMGGEQNIEDMKYALDYAKSIGLKTCLYTGSDNIEDVEELLAYLDYVKIGHYSDEFGGLDNRGTNQKMYRIVDGELVDITNRFWR